MAAAGQTVLDPVDGPAAPAAVLHVAGILDVRSVATVRTALDAAMEAGEGDVVLDLSALEAMDAAGLGVLVTAHRKAQRRSRRLVLRGAGGPVLRTLAVTRLHRVLHLERLATA